MLGDHALLPKGPMMYDCAVRVPLIVRWPDQVTHDRVSGFVGVHDIAATIRQATGLAATAGDQGFSLLSVATGEHPGRGYALTEYRDSGYAYDPPAHTTMYRTNRWKLVAWHGNPEDGTSRDGELDDLRADPDELNNLWRDPEHLAIRAELTAAMADALVSVENRSASREAPW